MDSAPGSKPVVITVCAGSSCHVRGARQVIARFAELIRREKLEDHVSLTGCFCMERCGEHINWKFNEEIISSPGVEEAVATLESKLVQLFQSGYSADKQDT